MLHLRSPAVLQQLLTLPHMVKPVPLGAQSQLDQLL